MIDGLLNLSWPWLLLITLLLTHITIASVTIFLHRHQSHRALDLHPVASHFFRFWLWLTTGMVTREWVAIHRKHHAFVDSENDPHSPQILGIGKVMREGTELYRKEAACEETLRRFGRGTPDDWLERHLYSRHPTLGIILMLIIDVVLFGVLGLTIWAVQMIWIPFFAAGVINGVGHWAGYRNHACGDASRNIVPWGILIGGEELHNNHHAHAASARLSHQRWEFDIGWLYIRILEGLRLARVRQVAPRPVVVRGKERIDLATARAIVHARLQVLQSYSRSVVRPVVREEIRRQVGSARRLLRQVKRHLLRAGTALEPQTRSTLEQAFSLSERLRTVHEFRQHLVGIWQRDGETTDSVLASLQEWCARAEQSGIDALARFAKGLRGYSLRAA
ncbi:MAG: acyl-CoA desaturase [Gammaproteobacteria bacterium]